MNRFSFSDEEFLDVVNCVVQKEIAMGVEFVPIATMEDSIIVTGLDSLGIMIIFVWLSEMFGIAEEEVDLFLATEQFSVSALKEFISAKATQTLTYVEAAEFET